MKAFIELQDNGRVSLLLGEAVFDPLESLLLWNNWSYLPGLSYSSPPGDDHPRFIRTSVRRAVPKGSRRSLRMELLHHRLNPGHVAMNCRGLYRHPRSVS
jgi:hypothetical protein